MAALKGKTLRGHAESWAQLSLGPANLETHFVNGYSLITIINAFMCNLGILKLGK
jgi:hypothetical protein